MTETEWVGIYTRIESEKRKALRRLAAERDTNTADLVRQAIDLFLEEEAR